MKSEKWKVKNDKWKTISFKNSVSSVNSVWNQNPPRSAQKKRLSEDAALHKDMFNLHKILFI